MTTLDLKAEREVNMILQEEGEAEEMALMTTLDLEAEREVNMILPMMEEEAANKVAVGRAANMILLMILQGEEAVKEMDLMTILDLAVEREVKMILAEREVKMTLAEKAAMETMILMVPEKAANMIQKLDLDQGRAVMMIQMEAEKEANLLMEEVVLCP